MCCIYRILLSPHSCVILSVVAISLCAIFFHTYIFQRSNQSSIIDIELDSIRYSRVSLVRFFVWSLSLSLCIDLLSSWRVYSISLNHSMLVYSIKYVKHLVKMGIHRSQNHIMRDTHRQRISDTHDPPHTRLTFDPFKSDIARFLIDALWMRYDSIIIIISYHNQTEVTKCRRL